MHITTNSWSLFVTQAINNQMQMLAGKSPYIPGISQDKCVSILTDVLEHAKENCPTLKALFQRNESSVPSLQSLALSRLPVVSYDRVEGFRATDPEKHKDWFKEFLHEEKNVFRLYQQLFFYKINSRYLPAGEFQSHWRKVMRHYKKNLGPVSCCVYRTDSTDLQAPSKHFFLKYIMRELYFHTSWDTCETIINNRLSAKEKKAFNNSIKQLIPCSLTEKITLTAARILNKMGVNGLKMAGFQFGFYALMTTGLAITRIFGHLVAHDVHPVVTAASTLSLIGWSSLAIRKLAKQLPSIVERLDSYSREKLTSYQSRKEQCVDKLLWHFCYIAMPPSLRTHSFFEKHLR